MLVGAPGTFLYNLLMNRRNFLQSAGGFLLGLAGRGISPALATETTGGHESGAVKEISLFLGGDFMCGRGIDQVLPHPSDPVLYESDMKSALDYVERAEQAFGPIPKPVSWDYIWGDGIEVLNAMQPDARIINLETAVTTSDEAWTGKVFHFRMHPENVPCLSAAGIDFCAQANNHALDWSYAGMEETIETLHAAGIHTAGTGPNLNAAQEPALMDLPGGQRLKIYSVCTRGSGIRRLWAATGEKAGVHELFNLSPKRIAPLTDRIGKDKQPGDIIVVSIHWGHYWNQHIIKDHRAFAHQMIDAGADVIHGHSSHRIKGIEVYRNRPILYGCGNLLDDYEGLKDSYLKMHGELALMYFVTLEAHTGTLRKLEMKPMQIRNFRLNHGSAEGALRARNILNRESLRFKTTVELDKSGTLNLNWGQPA